MQDKAKTVYVCDIHKGNIISIRSDSDVYLIKSRSIVDSSDQIMLELISLNGSITSRTVHPSDITLASTELVNKNTLFHSRDACPLCLSPIIDTQVLFTVKQLFWDIDIMSCQHCGMAYKAPLASPKLLSHIYTQNYTHHIAIETRKENIDMHRTRVERLGRARGRHLDYGCGAGGFVTACLNAGWDSYGADPYLPTITSDNTIAERLFKIDATDPTLLAVVGKFDCISIWAAVEHLTQFKDTIAGLVHLLNPGGTIVFNSPNPKSLIAKYSGKLWRMATLIEHVQYCTPQAANYIATTYGMSVQKLRICGSPYPQGQASSILDQGLATLPFFVPIKTEADTTLVPDAPIPLRKNIIAVIQNHLQGNTGLVAALIRQVIHICRLGDHIEVTMKLK